MKGLCITQHASSSGFQRGVRHVVEGLLASLLLLLSLGTLLLPVICSRSRHYHHQAKRSVSTAVRLSLKRLHPDWHEAYYYLGLPDLRIPSALAARLPVQYAYSAAAGRDFLGLTDMSVVHTVYNATIRSCALGHPVPKVTAVK